MQDETQQMWDILIDYTMKKPPCESLSDIKEYLKEIDHPEKDNASFVYECYQFFTEPVGGCL